MKTTTRAAPEQQRQAARAGRQGTHLAMPLRGAAPISPLLQRQCACGGGCTSCQTDRLSQSKPALLRCYQIAFPIHEEFGCCNMRTFGVFRPLWARFLRSTGTFTQGAQANLPGQREQGLSHRSETHAAKDSPFMLRNGDHHPCIGGGEFVRHISARLKVFWYNLYLYTTFSRPSSMIRYPMMRCLR